MPRKHRLGTADECSAPSGKYDVFATQGQGGGIDASFKTLAGALQFVHDNWGSACFAIRYPKGRWHKWSKAWNASHGGLLCL